MPIPGLRRFSAHIFDKLFTGWKTGFVKSRMGGATQLRGGRRKRIFSVTNAGLAMLRSMKEVRMDLWKLIPQLKIGL